jgi:Protein of unknown function (DUF5818)
MKKKLLMSIGVILACGCLAMAAGKSSSWVGVVSDSNCGLKHSTPSKAAAECVKKCVSMGAKYVLVHNGKVYKLDPQEKFDGLGGERVKVTGTMSGDSIMAESVAPVKSHMHMK